MIDTTIISGADRDYFLSRRPVSRQQRPTTVRRPAVQSRMPRPISANTRMKAITTHPASMPGRHPKLAQYLIDNSEIPLSQCIDYLDNALHQPCSDRFMQEIKAPGLTPSHIEQSPRRQTWQEFQLQCKERDAERENMPYWSK